ncbi:PAS domain-containing sensor histidine kinase [Actinoplanes siamensis]|nr:ATP-binding protein [Actinoplanes siamensis]
MSKLLAVDHRALFRSAPAALLALDTDLVIVEVSDAYLATTLRRREDLLGQPVFTAFPENPDAASDGVARLTASLDRVRREGVTDVMPVQKYDIALPGGGFEVRYWAPVNAPVFAADGRLSLFLHRVDDVTEYIRALDEGPVERLVDELRVRTVQMESEVFARRQAQERNVTLQAVVDALDTAVLACDPTGRPVLRNHAVRDLVGDLLDGRPAGDWPDQLRLPLTRALSGEPVRDAEVVLHLPGVPRRILRVHAHPLTGQSGLAAVVALRDVTGRSLAARLQEGELEVIHLIARGEPLHPVMRAIGESGGWTATEFWTVDDVTGALCLDAYWPEPPALCTELPERAWRAAAALWTTDPRTGAALVVPVPAGPKPLGVLVCRSDSADVPAELRTAVVTGIGARLGELLERRRAERLAAELDRTRDEYIALVGHELRTPLTSIQSYTDLMLDDPALDDEQREALEVMRRNTGRLRGIVMRLLDVAGMRWGHIELHRSATDLTEVVREAAAGRAHLMTDAPEPVIVSGDRERLREVVHELLDNAVTWAVPGTTIEVAVRAGERAGLIAVSNTGEPIPAGERGRLFDLFFRGEAARHQGVPGNGLGLTVARAIIEQHGGTLTVSETGETRTTFTVRLPARPPTLL